MPTIVFASIELLAKAGKWIWETKAASILLAAAACVAMAILAGRMSNAIATGPSFSWGWLSTYVEWFRWANYAFPISELLVAVAALGVIRAAAFCYKWVSSWA